jgi:transposase-like protein
MGKICYFCGKNDVIKKGLKNGKQRWHCKACGRYFLSRMRSKKDRIIELYIQGYYTARQLASLLEVSERTVFRALRGCSGRSSTGTVRKEIVAMMDTTYWGRNFGVVAIKDHFSGIVLWHKFIDRKEWVGDYVEGVQALEQQGFRILGVVSDGLKGLRDRLSAYPFQYCQFHQMQTVRLKLTANPKLKASRELLGLAGLLCHTDKESFVGLLNEWHAKWEGFLNERTADERGRTFYTHKNLRSAYNSIKRNMPWLWTFYDRPELGLPNTNNEMEALFSSVKDKLRLHRGLSVERRKVLIEELFSAHSPRR